MLIPLSCTVSVAPDVNPTWHRTAALLTRMPPQAIEAPTLLLPTLLTRLSHTAFVVTPGMPLFHRAVLFSPPVTLSLKLSIAFAIVGIEAREMARRTLGVSVFIGFVGSSSTCKCVRLCGQGFFVIFLFCKFC